MATGRLAFIGGTHAVVFEAILTGPGLPVLQLNHASSQDLGGSRRSCSRRIASFATAAAELRRDLKARQARYGIRWCPNRDTARRSGAVGYRPSSWSQRCPAWRSWSWLCLCARVAGLFGGLGSDRIHSIAVLPFVQHRLRRQRGISCRRITDGIINSLSRVPDLARDGPQHRFSYKGRDVSAQKVGQDLKVDAILLGPDHAKRRHAEHVKPIWSAWLTGAELWGGTVPPQTFRPGRDSGRHRQRIYEQLQPKLVGRETAQLTKRDTENSEAYQLYLQGLFYWNKWTQDGFQKSIGYFRQAVAKDPNYAQAYAGLADAYNFMGTRDTSLPRKCGRTQSRPPCRASRLMTRCRKHTFRWPLVREDLRLGLDGSGKRIQAGSSVESELPHGGAPLGTGDFPHAPRTLR